MTKEEAKKMGATHCMNVGSLGIAYLQIMDESWFYFDNSMNDWIELISTPLDIKPL